MYALNFYYLTKKRLVFIIMIKLLYVYRLIKSYIYKLDDKLEEF